MTWPTVARLALVRAFPLKSGAERIPERADLDLDGVVGDRAWAIADGSGTLLRPRHHPALARLSLAHPSPAHPSLVRPSPGRASGTPQLLLDGRSPVDAAGLAALLDVEGAHPVALGGAHDPDAARAALHLVGADAARDPDAPPGADPGRRANLVLADLPPGAERAWVGARLRVGAAGALLEVTATPRHCLGVYARVLVPGRVGVGDRVGLAPAAPGRADGRPRPDAGEQ